MNDDVVVLFALCFFASGGLVFVLATFAVVFLLIRRARGTSGSPQPAGSGFGLGSLTAWIARQNLVAHGTPARAIVLAITSTGSRAQFYGVPCELRGAQVDVELPGVAPFVTQADLYIPRSLVRDTLPGSTMEIRIDPARPTRIYVVGPDVGYAQGSVRTA